MAVRWAAEAARRAAKASSEVGSGVGTVARWASRSEVGGSSGGCSDMVHKYCNRHATHKIVDRSTFRSLSEEQKAA